MPLVGVRSLIETGTPWSGGSARAAAPERRRRAPRRGERGLARERDVGVEPRVDRVDPRQHRLHHLERRGAAGAVEARELGRRGEAEVAGSGHSGGLGREDLARIERVAEAVADVVDRQHGEEDRGAGEDRPVRREVQVVLGVEQDAAPRRDVGRKAEARGTTASTPR